MITADQLVSAGKVNKTHGVNGEMSISFYDADMMDAVAPGMCLVMDIDGIYTPFFVSSVRPRSNEALLISFDDVDSQQDAAAFVGKSVSMLAKDYQPTVDEDGKEGMYAAQLIGFKAIDADTGNVIGTIDDIDEATENVLFVISTEDGKTAYIPVVDEFISDISTKDHTITFDLPIGLLQI